MENTALVNAVQFGDLRVVKEYVGNRTSPNTTDADGCSLLHWAAINNRVGIALYLIERGADVNTQGGLLNETPLHWAVRMNFYRICQLLVERGADMTVRSNAGFDVLHLACQQGNLETIFVLLSLGADPNTPNDKGDTPLITLLHTKDVNLDIIRLMLRMGADVTIQNPSTGNNALHALCLARPKNILEIAFLLYTAPGAETAATAENHHKTTPWQVTTTSSR